MTAQCVFEDFKLNREWTTTPPETRTMVEYQLSDANDLHDLVRHALRHCEDQFVAALRDVLRLRLQFAFYVEETGDRDARFDGYGPNCYDLDLMARILARECLRTPAAAE